MRHILAIALLLMVSAASYAQVASPNVIEVAVVASETFTWEKVITLSSSQTADLAAVSQEAYLEAKSDAIAEDPEQASAAFSAESFTKARCTISGNAVANGFTTKILLMPASSSIDITAVGPATITLKGN